MVNRKKPSKSSMENHNQSKVSYWRWNSSFWS